MLATAEARLSDLVDIYIGELATHASPSHLRVASRQLRKIAEAVSSLAPIEVIRYRQRRLTEGVSHRTINMEVGVLRACLNWCEQTGLIETHSIDRVKALPMTEANRARRTRPLKDDERDKFLAASRKADRFRKVPQTPLWRLLIEVGVRWGDALALRWDHIDKDAGTITVTSETTKGRRSRVIPIPFDLIPDLRLPFCSPGGVPWTRKNERNARRLFHDTIRAAGFAPMDAAGRTICMHALRKTCGTNILRAGGNIVEAAAQLGHRDPAMTARLYAEASVEDLSRTMRTKVWAKRPNGTR